MNQALAKKLASEGFTFCKLEKYIEADKKYLEAREYVDLTHWSAQMILGEHAVVLKKLGRKNDALKALELALESSLLSDPFSNGVTVARHFLAEYLIELGKPEKALKVLLPVLSQNVEIKWLIHFSVAHAYFQIGDMVNCEKESIKVIKTSPKGKFKDVAAVKAQWCDISG